jgi:3-oxoacyl-[acyl-carrier protein] reductase
VEVEMGDESSMTESGTVHSLEGHVALVTGGGRGLGRETARELARRGADVAISYLSSREAAGEVSRAIREMGRKSAAIQADVARRDEAERMIDAARSELGNLDILVNNVGPFVHKNLSELGVDEWHAMIDGNLHSTFYCCRAALPGMRERGWGRIINIAVAGSDAARAAVMTTPYAIAKLGVVVLSRSLARVEGRHGITVNVVSPGLMDRDELTDEERREIAKSVPAGRPGAAADVASAVAYFASDAASYVTGANIVVSGGWMI